MQVLLPGSLGCFLTRGGPFEQPWQHKGGEGHLGGCNHELHIAMPRWMHLCVVTSDPSLPSARPVIQVIRMLPH